MKLSSLAGCATALLLAVFPIADAAPKPPIDAIVPRDFSAALRNFNQIQQLMHNLRSRIGVPFSAMRNVGLAFQQTLEVQPLDLVLLPNGYCFSCSTPPHTEPDRSKPPNLFHNEMVELDESQLLVACTDDTNGQRPDEWPLMRACPGQEKLLRQFLSGVCDHGNRLAIPKARLEKAPVFQVDKRTCMPLVPNQSTCSTTPLSTHTTSTLMSSTFRTETSTSRTLGDRLQDLVSSMYQHRNYSTTIPLPATGSNGLSTSTTAISSSVVNSAARRNPQSSSAPNSSILSPSSVDHFKTTSGYSTISFNSTYIPNSMSSPRGDSWTNADPPSVPSKPTAARKGESKASIHRFHPARFNSMTNDLVTSPSSLSQSFLESTKLRSSRKTVVFGSRYGPEPTTDPNNSEGRHWSAIEAYHRSVNAEKKKTSQVVSSTAPTLDDDPFFYPRVGVVDEEDHRKAVSILLAWRSSQSADMASISSSADHREAMSIMGAFQSSRDAWRSSYEAALKASSATSATSATSAASVSPRSNKGVNLAITTSTLGGMATAWSSSITPYIAPRTTDVDVATETSTCMPTSTDDEGPFLDGSPTISAKAKDAMITARAVCWPHHHVTINWASLFAGPPAPTKVDQGPRIDPNWTPPPALWETWTETKVGTETAHPETLAHLNRILSQVGLPTTSEWVTTITRTHTEKSIWGYAGE
jgi:hypothetical protein